MASICKALKKDMQKYNKPKVPMYHIRAEPIRPNELLYDKEGLAVAIKLNGKLLAILEGEE